MASSRGRSLAWLLASMLVATAAHADPSAADRETARGLMQQGRELRAKNDEKGALKSFQAADAIMHVPSTGMEVARSQVALGQLVEARDTIAGIRRIPAKPSDPVPFKEARAKAEELDASLNGRVPALTIWVKGAADDETPEVSIDGEALPAGVLGLPRAVDAGHHVVSVKSASGEAKQEIDVHEGEQKTVDLTLVAAATPVAAPPEEGSDEAEPEAAPPETRSHKPTVVTWAGVGLAGAGVIAGTVTGVLSLSKKSSLQRECANDVCGPSSYSDYDSAHSMATISTIGFIAAGVGAAVATVSLIVGHDVPAPEPAANPTAPPSPAAKRMTIVPIIGLGSAGFAGTF
jgi:hypothetical protein